MSLYISDIFITIPIREGGRKNFYATVNDQLVYFYKIREENHGNEYVEYFFGNVPRKEIPAGDRIEIIFEHSILGQNKIVLPALPPKRPIKYIDLRATTKNEMLTNTYIYPNRYFTISVYLEAI